ncbi:MAG TPA: DUF4340 domain-containing protein, partial [Burkholderiales bacterium]|nr:DUF4340 domain-containing protein [Burkholderiales bacterium]
KSRLFVNIVLLVVVAALAAAVYWQRKDREAAAYRLSALDPARVNSVRVEKPGQPPLVLERQGGGWRMTSPLAARAEAIQVERLLAVLAAESRQRLPAQDLARFELDRPAMRLVADGQALAFGTLNPLTQEQYVLAGEWVYLVDARRAADALAPASRYLSPRLLAEEETPEGFDFGDLSLQQTDGRWALQPSPPAQLSQDDLNRWVQEWRLARAQQVEPLAPASKPLSTVRLALAGGRSISIEVLAREPETVLARRDEGLEYRFPRAVGERLLNPPRE